MVGKRGVDKPYKSKVKICKEAQRPYSLRNRHSVSYNEAVLSCVNAGMDDDVTLERYNQTNTSYAGEATLKNDLKRGFHEKRPTATLSSFQKIQNVLHPVGDLTSSVTYNVSQTISCKEVKITNHYHTTFTDTNTDAGLEKSSTDVSDDKLDSSLWDSESDTISKSDTISDTWSDIEDDEKWEKGRGILTHLKSGQVNRLMSICEVCGTGFCRKGDLNAHMIMVHHQKGHQRYEKLRDIEPSMPQLTCEKNGNTLPHQQKCENPNTDVHTIPVLQCELPMDFIPSLSKPPIPNIPNQKCEVLRHPVLQCEALQHPVQKYKAPQNSVPSMRTQKCSQSLPGVSKLKNEAFHIPLLDKQDNNIEKMYGSSILQSKCEVSDNSTELKREGFSKLKCNPPLPKCIASDCNIYTETGQTYNTTRTYTVLSESNVQKWNVFNGNGTSTSEHKETEIHSNSFSSSRKLCTLGEYQWI
ncbi:uncharacterized protein LOC117340078 [Pecten maximus]|uniref:uncharacterized protein LOC117340078 n=1 Tax=Pecten maximus TaxID=6579 RepID=UPI0014587247|nr:uncharacterized protein LOC117340078 [Pecten maximus]